MNKFNTVHSEPDFVSNYLSAIEKHLKDVMSYVNIECVRCNNPSNGAYAFVAGNYAVGILIAELSTQDRNTLAPISDYSNDMQVSLNEQFDLNVILLQTFVVQNRDFARLKTMAACIDSTFKLNLNKGRESITSDFLMPDHIHYKCGGFKKARSYLQSRSPISAGPRKNFGLVLNSQNGTNEPIPILGVCGYVEIPAWVSETHDSGFNKKITAQPLVHISIEAEIPTEGMVLVALGLAHQHFIVNDTWKNYYDFDALKEYASSGMDEEEEKEENFAVELELLPVKLALDITEGQMTIASLIKYAIQPTQNSSNYFYSVAKKFFGEHFKEPLHKLPVYEIYATDYTGIAIDPDSGWEQISSSELDPSYIIHELHYTSDEAFELLNYSNDPTIRAANMINISDGTFQSLYRTTISVIEGSFLEALADASRKVLKL